MSMIPRSMTMITKTTLTTEQDQEDLSQGLLNGQARMGMRNQGRASIRISTSNSSSNITSMVINRGLTVKTKMRRCGKADIVHSELKVRLWEYRCFFGMDG